MKPLQKSARSTGNQTEHDPPSHRPSFRSDVECLRGNGNSEDDEPAAGSVLVRQLVYSDDISCPEASSDVPEQEEQPSLSPVRRLVAKASPPAAVNLSDLVNFHNVPDLCDAAEVCLCETERDAEALLSIGINASCPAFGILGLNAADFGCIARIIHVGRNKFA